MNELLIKEKVSKVVASPKSIGNSLADRIYGREIRGWEKLDNPDNKTKSFTPYGIEDTEKDTLSKAVGLMSTLSYEVLNNISYNWDIRLRGLQEISETSLDIDMSELEREEFFLEVKRLVKQFKRDGDAFKEELREKEEKEAAEMLERAKAKLEESEGKE